MALDDQDIQKIEGLIKTTFQSLPTVLNEKLERWMETEVIPMINGAKRSTLVDVENKLGVIQTTVADLQKNQEEREPVDIEAAISASLEKILGESGEQEGSNSEKKTEQSPNSGLDVERLKKDLFAEFQTKFMDPLKQRVDQAEADRERAVEEKQAIEAKQSAQQRDDGFIQLLSKHDAIASDAAKQAFRTMVDEGLIQSSSDGSRYVVKGRDKYDQEDVFTPASDVLDQLVQHDSLRYFRPARQGTGVNSTPAKNGAVTSDYKVIDPSASLAGDQVLELMKQNPDDFLQDLDNLATAS